MKKTAWMSLSLFACVAFVLLLYPQPTYAVEIIGGNTGLAVEVGGEFVPTNNLNPGDVVSSKMTVFNQGQHALGIQVYLGWEITDRKPGPGNPGGGDIEDKLLLTVLNGDEQIFKGRFGDLTEYLPIGNIAPSQSRVLTFIVDLPGYETTNEYQGASLSVKWFVMAQLPQEPGPGPSPSPDVDIEDDPPPGGPADEPGPGDQPKTGDAIRELFYSLGAISMAFGLLMAAGRKKRRASGV